MNLKGATAEQTWSWKVPWKKGGEERGARADTSGGSVKRGGY